MGSDTASRAQAFLFTEGGSLPLKKLASLLGIKQPELKTALTELSERLQGSGLSLIVSDTEASLSVAPESSEAVRAAYRQELEKDIGDAGLEVLAIVLYRGPSTRSQIDYIRGVNTSSTIRNLLARGLVERAGNPEDAREYLYHPTVELLAHLGVRAAKELPEYEKMAGELAAFENSRKESGETSEDTAV